MRRLLLLALLAPVVTLPQTVPDPTPGSVSFANELHSANDSFINAAECAGGTVLVQWDIENTATTITSFTVYAHNRTSAHTEQSTGACPTVDQDGGDTALRVGPIATFDDVAVSNPNGVTEPSAEIGLDAAFIVSVAGKSCGATADEDIVLCVQANNNGGTARGKVVLSTRAPGKPTAVTAGSGSGALNVEWTAPSGSPQAEYYVIEAAFDSTTTQAIDPSLLGTVTSGAVTATSHRLTGLVNSVIYRVRVYAFSTADNRSVGSDDTRGMPELANDFWTAYKAAGGQEEGGCGFGSAGAIGIVLAAAALAVLRRRS